MAALWVRRAGRAAKLLGGGPGHPGGLRGLAAPPGAGRRSAARARPAGADAVRATCNAVPALPGADRHHPGEQAGGVPARGARRAGQERLPPGDHQGRSWTPGWRPTPAASRAAGRPRPWCGAPRRRGSRHGPRARSRGTRCSTASIPGCASRLRGRRPRVGTLRGALRRRLRRRSSQGRTGSSARPRTPSLADDPEFAGYLRNRARDLLSATTTSPGDASWVTGRFKHLNAPARRLRDLRRRAVRRQGVPRGQPAAARRRRRARRCPRRIQRPAGAGGLAARTSRTRRCARTSRSASTT